MKISNLSFFFVIVFSVFGFIVFSYIIHELSHWQDFREIAEDDRICFRIDNFSLFGDGATYSFYPVEGSEEEIERIRGTRSLRLIQYAVLLVIFSVCFSVVFWKWFGK